MKTDKILGQEVKEHLAKHNVESPIDFDVYHKTTSKEKVDFISSKMTEILTMMGFDLTNDSVADTPSRVAKMWVSEVMSGLDYDNFPKVMTFENKFDSTSMVVERNVKSMSLCSHHLVTIDGKCTVAYIPNKKIIGLSKIPRVINFFSRRPQEAERLTLQIYHALQYILDTDDIAVYVTGVHYCVKSRGIEDAGADTVTSHLGGAFKTNPDLRKEFFDAIK